MNLPPKPLPSPSPHNGRRALNNLTNLPEHSQCGALNRPSSTKNIRSRISIDEWSRPKLKVVHSRKNSRSELPAVGPEAGQACRNHADRAASHAIEFDRSQYFCFECSLLYAKKGYKIKPIAASGQAATRQKEVKDFLQKCAELQSSIVGWTNQCAIAVEKVTEEAVQMLAAQKIRMEEQIKKIREVYAQNAKSIQETRSAQISKLTQVGQQIQKIARAVSNTKADIQDNYQDCVKVFSFVEFREIMDKYWKQIGKSEDYILCNKIKQVLSTSLQTSLKSLKQTQKTMGRSNNMSAEFTFSKEAKFETPPFNKEIRGIKLVESQPDSNRYSPSLRESMVDSKISFNDFNL